MRFAPASQSSVVAFMVVIAAVLIAFRVGVHVSSRRLGLDTERRDRVASLATLLWFSIFIGIVYSGLPARKLFPAVPLLFVFVFLSAIALAASSYGSQLARGLGFSSLVLFHVFRLPLEIILHAWAKQGTIPVEMTWNGQNFDVITGVLALLLFYPARHSARLALVFNVVGMALLLNVIRVALFCAPVPFGWNVTPPLLLAVYLPYALIAPVCVGGAFAAHLILFRKLAGVRAR